MHQLRVYEAAQARLGARSARRRQVGRVWRQDEQLKPIRTFERATRNTSKVGRLTRRWRCLSWVGDRMLNMTMVSLLTDSYAS